MSRATSRTAPEGGTRWSALDDARFALTKVRLPALPTTYVTRTGLHQRLDDFAGRRLTVVVGSAGAGKTVTLAGWAEARAPQPTSWLSCDAADVDPIRFWGGFVESIRVVAPGFGAVAAHLLEARTVTIPEVVASLANDVARLPPGFAVVVDDFGAAEPKVAKGMTELVDRWPRGGAQLVIASRRDPQLRLHRLRMDADLGELRDRDLDFSFSECRELLARFEVEVAPSDVALVHQRTEGWPAALQMTVLGLRSSPARAMRDRVLDLRTHDIAEYYVSEVLDQQSAEVTTFLLDTSMLDELTAESCAAVTGRSDAGTLLRDIEAAHLFLVAVDDEHSRFRYHSLVREVMNAELRVRDRDRERALHRRAADWYESTGDARRAARHLVALQDADRALELLQDRVVVDFLRDPSLAAPLDVDLIDSELLAAAPDRALAVATDLLLSGDAAQGGRYLDLLEQVPDSIAGDTGLSVRLHAARALRHMLTGRPDEAAREALALRALRDQPGVEDTWSATVAMILLRVYTWLEDFDAAEREAATALESRELPAPVGRVLVPGLLASARFDAGRLDSAAAVASGAIAEAGRLGLAQHFLATDALHVLTGIALERGDVAAAWQLAEEALSTTGPRRPLFEFRALLDQAHVQAARGDTHEALATVGWAREALVSPGTAVLTRADELEAELRLALGDIASATQLAARLPHGGRELMRARIALAVGDVAAAESALGALPVAHLSPRRSLVRQLVRAAVAIERGDPKADGVLAAAIELGRRGGFCRTLVSTVAQVTDFLVEHATPTRADPYADDLVRAALDVRIVRDRSAGHGRPLVAALTPAERRVLDLLPTSTYRQMAAALFISPHTVKSHLRAVYRKLGAETRSEALQRAVDLRLL